MASVIRIKRRRTDDPAEALILSHKKSRFTTNPNVLDASESVLEFAGTLASKNEPVSTHIKEAIRRRKIHKEMHPHSSNFKTAVKTDVTGRLRRQKAEASQNNRYRITYRHRALDIDNLDCDEAAHKTEDTLKDLSEAADRLVDGLLSDVDKENAITLSKPAEESQQTSEQESSPCKLPGSPDGKPADVRNPSQVCDAACSPQKEEKVFCLIDVEQEKGPDQDSKAAASAITVNGVPMTQVTSKVPIAEESDDYVYDLYFTHTRLGDIQDEAVVTVQALCTQFLHDNNLEEDEEDVYEDEDDSNDESNWRNDYPDEDPYFFENADRDYEYRNDMRESLFHGGEDDEGDLLSYWMDTRCRVDADCSDFEEEYEKDGSSSEGGIY